jgi:hypothetical protein
MLPRRIFIVSRSLIFIQGCSLKNWTLQLKWRFFSPAAFRAILEQLHCRMVDEPPSPLKATALTNSTAREQLFSPVVNRYPFNVVQDYPFFIVKSRHVRKFTFLVFRHHCSGITPQDSINESV